MIEKIYHKGLREGMDQPNSFESLLRTNPGDMLEMDVTLLADGSLAVAHHRDIKMDLSDLESRNVKQFEVFDQPTKSGTTEPCRKLPLLEEVLGLGSDYGARLLIELKGSSIKKFYELTDALAKKLKQMVTEGAFKENPDFVKNNLSFITQSIDGMIYFKRAMEQQGFSPSLVLAWPGRNRVGDSNLTSNNLSHLEADFEEDYEGAGVKAASQLGCLAVVLNMKDVLRNPDYVKKAHDLGLLIYAFGSEKKEDKAFAKEVGVDSYLSEEWKSIQ